VSIAAAGHKADARRHARGFWEDTMSREELIAMTRNLVAHGAADTMEYADEVVRVPASAYTDQTLFELEKKQIFRRLPLLVAPSCELPNAGDFKAMDLCGVPLLLAPSSTCAPTAATRWPMAAAMPAASPAAITAGPSRPTAT
jgi:hypothetical protein